MSQDGTVVIVYTDTDDKYRVFETKLSYFDSRWGLLPDIKHIYELSRLSTVITFTDEDAAIDYADRLHDDHYMEYGDTWYTYNGVHWPVSESTNINSMEG